LQLRDRAFGCNWEIATTFRNGSSCIQKAKKNQKQDDHQISHDHSRDPHHSAEEHVEEHAEEGEPWLVSYADMMTLLFGFFVVMYSFASKNTSSQEYIKMKLENAFNGKVSVEGMDIVELTERLVQVMAQNAEEDIEAVKNSGLSETKNINAPKKIDNERTVTLGQSLKVLLAGIDKDVFEKDEKQAALFEDLKGELDEKLKKIKDKVEGKEPRSIISISLSTLEVFNTDDQLSPKGKEILQRISTQSKKMNPKPEVKVEVYSEVSASPKDDIAKTLVLANRVSQYFIDSGLDPSLFSSSAYGSMKTLVDPLDKKGIVDKIANSRNNRIIITVEKRLKEKNTIQR
jgi:chemotaxis protein MotB